MAVATDPAAPRPAGRPVGRLGRAARATGADARLLVSSAALGAIALGLDQASDGAFLSPRNLYNLAVQSSAVGVMACGMVFVIVSRHIDLSVGSVLGITGMAIAVLQAEVLPPEGAAGWPLALAIGLALGAAIGAWHGYWIAYRGLPAFVVTLAGLLVFRGGTWLLTDGRTVAPLHPSYALLGGGLHGSIGAGWSAALGAGAIAAVVAAALRARRDRRRHGMPARPPWAEAVRLLAAAAVIAGFVGVMNAHTLPRSDVARGVPVPVLIGIAAALTTWLLSRATRFGRYVFAIGGNPEAARLSGVDVRRVTLGVFTLMGFLAAVAGVLTTARLGAGTSSMGTLAELSVIAAAVIGGTSLSGGAGSVPGAILGAVIMQSLENGMVLLGVGSALRQVLIGLVLIAAVWIDTAAGRRRALA